MPWLTLDSSHLTDSEYSVGTSLAETLADLGDTAATLQVSDLDEHGRVLTTIIVVRRPTETLLLVVRPDRSVVVATDDIYALRWTDPS